jgi:hypothetical protein
MEERNKELELHSKISAKIFETLDGISDEGEDGNINTRTARRIIKMVRNFNFTREVLMERFRSGIINQKEFRMELNLEGQKCIDSINRIMSESSSMAAI